MRPVLLLLALAAPGGLWAQIDYAVVARSTGQEFAINSIPCVTSTPGGNLIAVWTAHRAGASPKLRVVGAISRDDGLTWSAPVSLIDNPGKTDADPNLVIDGRRII